MPTTEKAKRRIYTLGVNEQTYAVLKALRVRRSKRVGCAISWNDFLHWAASGPLGKAVEE